MPSKPLLSRGKIIMNYLKGQEGFEKSLLANQKSYAGFNLIYGDKNGNMSYICHDNDKADKTPRQIIRLEKDTIYGMSNTHIQNPWAKVENGKQIFKELIQNHEGE
jgi:uncharacterized protein with NRDE domain